MGNDFSQIIRYPEFDRDLKKLMKRFPTLEEDLQNFINAQLIPFHKMNIDNHGIFRIPDLGFDYPPILKAKKFACRSLKGSGAMSGIRVIYGWFFKEDRIELIEIYYKGIKENCDLKRLKRLFS